ncbi:Retrovirus-related Pol polyprotein from transposon TNT 1-94 [Melia azedarach]|uniref:Retrovirus-related Pol polyprotein from transposon TNT 1-94 n=1 Tax=Melia azedarach TaxID=155640 RepID=A0ACC1YBM5_MELAZ|nr:Retrovirus-related Pol polyprotein from transposon TNT 1-94 [Melia azedarach]
MIENQFQQQIKILRSDNGAEYYSEVLGKYLEKQGIIHQSSCVGTPQQNGIAERKNIHLLEVARALLFQMKVSKVFWGDAILTACYLINRMPTRVLNFDTPFKTLEKSFPSSKHLISSLSPRVFGCTAYVHNQDIHKSKLDPRALKCMFVGYSPFKKGYKCFHPPTRKYFVSLDVTFVENQPYQPTLQGENTRIEEELAGGEETSESWEDILNTLPISSSSHKEELEIANDLFQSDHIVEPVASCDLFQSDQIVEPVASSQEQQQPSSPQELKVYSRRQKETIHSPKLNQSLEPEKAIPEDTSKFLNSSLDDLDIPIALRKGVRSCTQHPIANFISYKKINHQYKAFITNVSTLEVPKSIQEAMKDPKWRAAVLEEMIALKKNNTWELIKLPTGKKTVGCKWVFTIKFKADGTVERYKARLVAKGYTQTYGIDYQETFAPVAKMSTVRVLLSLAVHRDWFLYQLDVKNAFLHGNLEEEVYMDIPPGFETTMGADKACKLKKIIGDHTLFFKHGENGKFIALLVYVDDIILTGNDEEEARRLKEELNKEFEIKDLGNLRYFLGIEVARSRKGIFLSQRKYVTDLLKETGMLGCKAVGTPIEVNHKLETLKGGLVNKEKYQRLVGMGLLFTKVEKIEVEVYTDADWAGSSLDRRSISGYCTFLGGNLVTWRSKKQSVVARSSAEVEFRSIALGIFEVMWLKTILKELRVETSDPMKLYCDNKAAISIAHNPVQHDRTKHVEIDRHFIKEKIEEGIICVPFVRSKDQLADVFTKGLPTQHFWRILSKLRIHDIFKPA